MTLPQAFGMALLAAWTGIALGLGLSYLGKVVFG